MKLRERAVVLAVAPVRDATDVVQGVAHAVAFIAFELNAKRELIAPVERRAVQLVGRAEHGVGLVSVIMQTRGGGGAVGAVILAGVLIVHGVLRTQDLAAAAAIAPVVRAVLADVVICIRERDVVAVEVAAAVIAAAVIAFGAILADVAARTSVGVHLDGIVLRVPRAAIIAAEVPVAEAALAYAVPVARFRGLIAEEPVAAAIAPDVITFEAAHADDLAVGRRHESVDGEPLTAVSALDELTGEAIPAYELPVCDGGAVGDLHDCAAAGADGLITRQDGLPARKREGLVGGGGGGVGGGVGHVLVHGCAPFCRCSDRRRRFFPGQRRSFGGCQPPVALLLSLHFVQRQRERQVAWDSRAKMRGRTRARTRLREGGKNFSHTRGVTANNSYTSRIM